jgi:glycosyltransferase involved in cell wall biosynthesis
MSMKVLLLHNRYRWRGGEGAVFEAEAALLRERNHEVVEHVADNRDIIAKGKLATLWSLWQAARSRRSYDRVRGLCSDVEPDVVHVHNFWYALSPSVLSACHDAGFPVVLTLHNFRLLCPGAVLLDKDGRPCQACVENGPGLGVKRHCYHDSWFASWAVSRMIKLNKARGTWDKDVDLYIVPSEFCREVFVRGGFPSDKLVVKPNFVRDPYADEGLKAEGRGLREPRQGREDSTSTRSPASGGLPSTFSPQPVLSNVEGPSASPPRVLFIGRLSREKGLKTLLAAWRKVEAELPEAELRLVGDGPMFAELKSLSEGLNVSFAGRVEGDELFREIEAARFTVLPSECYETFGRVVVESYACGRPAVVSDIGGPAELVRDGETGLLFEPGNTEDLAAKILKLLNEDSLRAEMGAKAREEYLASYTPEQNYELLMQRYEDAISRHESCTPKDSV